MEVMNDTIYFKDIAVAKIDAPYMSIKSDFIDAINNYADIHEVKSKEDAIKEETRIEYAETLAGVFDEHLPEFMKAITRALCGNCKSQKAVDRVLETIENQLAILRMEVF